MSHASNRRPRRERMSTGRFAALLIWSVVMAVLILAGILGALHPSP